MNANTAKILVVDDDEDLLTLICEKVESAGFTALGATSCDEGMKILRETKIVAVLSDIKMADGTGIDLLKRAQVFGIAPPFAFVTGYGTADNLLSAVRLGATDFLFKPFSDHDLKNTLLRISEIGERQIHIKEILDDIGTNLAPRSRELIDDLVRQIGLLRVGGVLGDRNTDKTAT